MSNVIVKQVEDQKDTRVLNFESAERLIEHGRLTLGTVSSAEAVSLAACEVLILQLLLASSSLRQHAICADSLFSEWTRVFSP